MNAIDLSRLRNGEIITFGRNYVKIIRLNDAALLKVTDETDKLDEIINQIDQLFLISQKSQLTIDIETLDTTRDHYVTGILNVIAGHVYNFKPTFAQAAATLTGGLSIYGGATDIVAMNYGMETAQVDSMVKDVLGKPALLDAAKILGIEDWFSELDKVNKAFDDKYIARTQELGNASLDNIKGLRETAMTDYYELRDMLDSQYIINKKINPWKKTVNELNALIDQYVTLIARRKPSKDEEVPTPPVV